MQALSLAKECYSMKLDLLTNATVVDDAIRFVSANRSKEKLKISVDSSNEDDKCESKEPNYNEDDNQVEEEQEEESGEMTSATTNQVF
jgi:hypothetical protein